MDFNQAALELHEKYHGKVGMVSKTPIKNREQLSTAYTPGVAEPCRRIAANPDDVYKYTFKSNMVAVVTNGTAVLGLGNIGAAAGLPVMEGKCALFKEFGGVEAFPICLDSEDPEEVIRAVEMLAPQFGGINLEDIRSPECFEIERRLEEKLVWRDNFESGSLPVNFYLKKETPGNSLKIITSELEAVVYQQMVKKLASYKTLTGKKKAAKGRISTAAP